MTIEVVTTADSFARHLEKVLDDSVVAHSEVSAEVGAKGSVVIIQLTDTVRLDLATAFDQLQNQDVPITIASDQPTVAEMLRAVELGARSYFNTYMQATHYQQMISMVQNGQSWFPPELLTQTFSLARQTIDGKDTAQLLLVLTDREKEIAMAVSDGKSNRDIAEVFDISERTVKAHLTNIFAKLEIKDRVGLVLYLK